MKWRLVGWTAALIALVLSTGALVRWSAMAADWRTASREPAGIAPDPAATREAVVQVYTARAVSWRGFFGVHSWIAAKPEDAPGFTVYEVIGWRILRGTPGITISNRAPDGRWFGALPDLIADLRGERAKAVLAKLDDVVRNYPYMDQYRLWPGPNSNTFVAYVGREIPELRLDLPPTAIGKDYLTNGSIFAHAPSRTGYQVSLFGLLGVLAAAEEGLEINLLGLSFGIDPAGLALRLPFIGRLGPDGNS